MKHTNHICKIRVDMFHSPFPPPFLYLKNTSQNARLHVLKSLENMTQRRHRVRKKILGNKPSLFVIMRLKSQHFIVVALFLPLIAAEFCAELSINCVLVSNRTVDENLFKKSHFW